MIAWVNTPEGEGALVGFFDDVGEVRAVVLIGRKFRAFALVTIEWLRWPE